MTIITFSVLLDKLLSRDKSQTIRLLKPKWKSLRIGIRAQLWWRYGTDEAVLLGYGKITAKEFKRGYNLIDADAVPDGFSNVLELRRTLAELNNMTMAQVLMAEWAIISWEWV